VTVFRYLRNLSGNSPEIPIGHLAATSILTATSNYQRFRAVTEHIIAMGHTITYSPSLSLEMDREKVGLENCIRLL